ncbi:MAG: riboflavin synthase [Chloroflexi bacterium]|nr:riboflavin synthase [Chloroflexota bacterium]
MFTGIIEEVGRVAAAQPGNLAIAASQVLQGTKPGDSIAVNGVCLTVTSLSTNSFAVYTMPETLSRSNLGQLSIGDRVNLERALAVGGRLGGHLVQGHVDAIGRLASTRWDGKAMLVTIEAPPEVMRYVVEKGFIAVDGISLTVTSREADSFQVSIVDFTRQHTNLGDRRVGDLVNLEIDIIAKYIEQLNQARSGGITAEFLQKHGFLVG